MKLLDKIEKFEIEAKQAEENYKAMGADREKHQKRMLELIHKKMEDHPTAGCGRNAPDRQAYSLSPSPHYDSWP